MAVKNRRKRYFVDPSCQIKYITFSILPALIVSLFCTSLLIYTGESILNDITKRLYNGIGEISLTVYRLESGKIGPSGDGAAGLKRELEDLKATLDSNHFDALQRWRTARWMAVVATAVVLLVAGVLALFHSHRVAGPTIRLRHCMDSLARGEDIPPVRLRTGDQFTELADSLENLRVFLKNRDLSSKGS